VTDDLDILADLADDAGRDELRAALNRALRLLARARAKTEDLVDAVYRAAGDALIAEGTRETPAPVLTHGGGGPEHALWHLTDWQGGKRTVSYSSEVMRSSGSTGSSIEPSGSPRSSGPTTPSRTARSCSAATSSRASSTSRPSRSRSTPRCSSSGATSRR
jgi:hypothetical protein